MTIRHNPSITISALKSGSGKTTITMGIISALKKRGIDVQPFKVGPDYIDIKYHEYISGNSGGNLDSWMMTEKYILRRVKKEGSAHDLSVIEGVMGLYDGIADVKQEYGSTAHIAKILSSPVILIVEAEGASRTISAIIKGVEDFDKKVNIAGIIFNKISGIKHFNLLKEAVSNYSKAKVLGFISKNEKIAIPSRHLGLTTSVDSILTPQFINKLSSIIEEGIDIDAIIKIAYKKSKGKFPLISSSQRIKSDNKTSRQPRIKAKPFCKMAVAYDDAFCFYYKDNFNLLREAGVELVFFSPLQDKKFPKGIKGIYIGGGYPELFAEPLHNNIEMRIEVKKFADKGGLIYAECGGLMYLTNEIEISDKRYKMTGVFPAKTAMLHKRKALGYVTATVLANCIIADKGDILKGHEYHYSDIIDMPPHIERIYSLSKNGEERREGYRFRNVIASYLHIHFGGNNGVVKKLAFYMKNY